MIVQRLAIIVSRASRCISETHMEVQASVDQGERVRELSWLKENDLFLVVSSNHLVHLLVKGLEHFFVEVSWLEQIGLIDVKVCRPGLVDRIVADHEFIVGKAQRNLFPEAQEVVKNTILILVEAGEG